MAYTDTDLAGAAAFGRPVLSGGQCAAPLSPIPAIDRIASTFAAAEDLAMHVESLVVRLIGEAPEQQCTESVPPKPQGRINEVILDAERAGRRVLDARSALKRLESAIGV
jgi:hypothetical protein